MGKITIIPAIETMIILTFIPGKSEESISFFGSSMFGVSVFYQSQNT